VGCIFIIGVMCGGVKGRRTRISRIGGFLIFLPVFGELAMVFVIRSMEDENFIWDTVTQEIPILREQIARIITQEFGSPQ
jgi:hypothetical protein